MDNSGLLTSAKKLVGELNERLKKFGEESESLSQIEIDLLKEKTRITYDLLLKLSSSEGKFKEDKIEAEKPVIPSEPKMEMESVSEIKEEISAEQEIIIDPIINAEIMEEELPDQEQDEISVPAIENEPDLFVERHEPENTEIVIEEEIIPVPEEKEPLEKISEIDLFSDNTVGEKFEAKKTIVEKINEEQKVKSIGDKIQKDRITGLKNAIGINEKFYFINELFSGDMKIYNDTIEKLDSMDELDSGIAFLNDLKSKYNWKEDAVAYIQLVDFINRKFK